MFGWSRIIQTIADRDKTQHLYEYVDDYLSELL
jgi:hypothetical protein